MDYIDSGGLKSRFREREIFFCIAAILGIVILSSWAYLAFGTHVEMTLQSRDMLARSLKISRVFRPSTWPPGYPLLLFGARHLYFPLNLVNLTLFYITLGLLFVVGEKTLPNISPIWLPLVYGAGAYNYYNLSQFTSEALVIPLSLLVFLILLSYLKQPTLVTILLLALCCSAAFVSRFHATLWLLPLVFSNLVFLTYQDRRFRILHWICFCLVAMVPLGEVLMKNYLALGYPTGMERFDWASRGRPNGAYSPLQFTDFFHNVVLTGKTYVLDFASPFMYASHDANSLAYNPSIWELAVIGLFLLIAVIILITTFRYINRTGTLLNALRSWHQISPITMLTIEFFLSYLVVTIAIWTIGNNDPIYSRFMYPSYVYFLLVIFVGYSFVKSTMSRFILRLPFALLMISTFVLNIYKLTHVLMVSQ